MIWLTMVNKSAIHFHSSHSLKCCTSYLQCFLNFAISWQFQYRTASTVFTYTKSSSSSTKYLKFYDRLAKKLMQIAAFLCMISCQYRGKIWRNAVSWHLDNIAKNSKIFEEVSKSSMSPGTGLYIPFSKILSAVCAIFKFLTANF